jgi:hypothetical protein
MPKSAELNSEPSAERSSPHDTATLGAGDGHSNNIYAIGEIQQKTEKDNQPHERHRRARVDSCSNQLSTHGKSFFLSAAVDRT